MHPARPSLPPLPGSRWPCASCPPLPPPAIHSLFLTLPASYPLPPHPSSPARRTYRPHLSSATPPLLPRQAYISSTLILRHPTPPPRQAYVIYNFYAYLMAYLEDTVGDLERHLAKKPPMQHVPIVRWLVPPWPVR